MGLGRGTRRRGLGDSLEWRKDPLALSPLVLLAKGMFGDLVSILSRSEHGEIPDLLEHSRFRLCASGLKECCDENKILGDIGTGPSGLGTGVSLDVEYKPLLSCCLKEFGRIGLLGGEESELPIGKLRSVPTNWMSGP